MPSPSNISRQPSRASLVSIPPSTRSRRASISSNEDIFADDHSLGSPVTIDDAPLGNVAPPRQQYFDDPFHDRNASTSSLDHTQSIPLPPLDRSSVAKRRLMIDDMPTTSTAGPGRTMSTSSRSTIPRAQSPYTGPTAPSHPYNMYSQVTRASSIASQSTFRPGSESPFVHRGGPEHPYELYPQNTVPVPDEDITAHGIPLGFSRNQNFQPSSGGSSTDIGDIIGSDGHIEQLPPYSRYADNTVAKGNMDEINRARLSRMSRVSLAQSLRTQTTAAPQPSGTSSTTLLPRETLEIETEAQRARKEGWRETWKEKAQRKTILGLPLWGLVSLVLAVVFAATIGGVVGGVIGNRQGAQRAYANGAVTTIWLDAIPTTLGPNASPLPTGHYQIPFNQSEEIKDCIPNPLEMGPAWGCMDIAYIGINVYEDVDGDSMRATFEDFSVNTQDFKYGPQPPDFNGSSFVLQPMQDKDAGAWGVAMFFTVLFDKLSILPEDALSPPGPLGKRSVPADLVARNVAIYDGTPLQPSQRPWFCFWNSTINEFFVYLNQEAPTESGQSSAYGYQKSSSSSGGAATTPFIPTTTSGVLAQELTMTTSPTPSATTFLAYNPTYPGAGIPTTATTWNKRSYETSAANVSNYPKLIKMVEKRQPLDPDSTDYVQPYCQMMQVLDDWSIEPIETVPPICIEEVQYTTSASSSPTKRSLKRGPLPLPDNERDVVGDLESYCICEWTSY